MPNHIITGGYGGGNIILQGYGAGTEIEQQPIDGLLFQRLLPLLLVRDLNYAALSAAGVVSMVAALPRRESVFALEERESMGGYNAVSASEPIVKHPADDTGVVLGFEGVLPAGASIVSIDEPLIELASGEEVAALEVSEPVVIEDDAETRWGHVVRAGRGVQLSISAGTAGCSYRVTLVVETDEGTRHGGVFIVEVYS